MNEPTVIDTICKTLCQSGKFETGEGTCALVCMDQLGSARKDCRHRNRVHSELAFKIIKDLTLEPGGR